MNIKRSLIHYTSGVAVAGAWVLGFGSPVAAVPECDCTVHNFPEPGKSTPAVRDEWGECQLDPCAS